MRALAVLALALTGCAAAHAAPTTPARPDTGCRGDVVTVWRDDPTPCDVRPPTRLDVVGITPTECADIGGIFDEPDICTRVDY